MTPRSGAHMETMAFYFPASTEEGELVLHWGTTVVPLAIECAVDAVHAQPRDGEEAW